MQFFHGTYKHRGRSILDNNRMEYSRGDGEWLGDGIYLYREGFLAYRWITIQYKKHYKNTDYSKVFEHYMILEVDALYNYQRVFSFTNPEYQMEFLSVKEKCLGISGYSERINKQDITDGVIINFMFQNMGYDEDFDMVEAVFPLITDKKESDSRLNMLMELQFCIKNEEIIQSIKDASDKFSPIEYWKRLRSFNSYRTQIKQKKSYSKTKGRIRYDA